MLNEEMTIDDVLEAFHHYEMAAGEEDSARRAYAETGDMSWDYHGEDLIKRRDEARDAAQKSLDGYIDHRVRAILAEHASS